MLSGFGVMDVTGIKPSCTQYLLFDRLPAGPLVLVECVNFCGYV